MGNDDCQERIKRSILKKLDDLNVDRKKSYSNRIELLLNFCDENKIKFEKWVKKK